MELNGTVQSIIFRNATNGYTVLSLLCDDEKQTITCVGSLPLVNVGDSVSLFGEESYHPRFGRSNPMNAERRPAIPRSSSISRAASFAASDR